jgi:hypothetical protein
MLRTVEATFDPSSGVHFAEPVNIAKPVRILVTFMETASKSSLASVKDKRCTLSDWLNSHPVCDSGRTPDDMDRYIQELRSSWE